jgi:hypothetical protein
MCKRYRSTHKLNKHPKGVYVKFVSASAHMQRSQMTPDLYVLNWKSSYDVMLLIFQSRQQHFAKF